MNGTEPADVIARAKKRQLSKIHFTWNQTKSKLLMLRVWSKEVLDIPKQTRLFGARAGAASEKKL